MPDWDQRYRQSPDALFGDAPNSLVRYAFSRPDFTARSALCLGDGDGRNGRWLAEQGLAVTSVDLSGVATRKAIELDAAAGVHCRRVCADLNDWRPDPTMRWDSVFLISVHCERDVRRRAVEVAGAALRVGGWFIAEGFAQRVDEPSARMGPTDHDLLYGDSDVIGWLPGFEIIERSRGVVRLSEGAKHQGLATVQRYMLRRSIAEGS